jgi:hypothetical protein
LESHVKFMLMMHTPRGTGEYGINNWSPEAFKNHIAFMHAFNRELIDAGEFVQGEGLTPPAQAHLVRADKNGAPATDGVFPEAKEFLAGFWIIDVDSLDRARAVAAKASTAPGPNGQPLDMAIEVRPIMSGPPPHE